MYNCQIIYCFRDSDYINDLESKFELPAISSPRFLFACFLTTARNVFNGLTVICILLRVENE